MENISQYIVDKNNQFVIAHKPPGMPCVADKTEDPHLQGLIEAYSKHQVHVLTRVDRPVSGLVLIAKSKSGATTLSHQLQNKQIRKKYLAIVEGKMPSAKGTLINHLHKKGNKTQVLVTPSTVSKKAELNYKVIKVLDNYSMVLIEIITGRYHQIRSQFAHVGCPIKGDVKYGARRGNKDRSIHLHAFALSFFHPVTKAPCAYQSPPNMEDSLWKLLPENIDLEL